MHRIPHRAKCFSANWTMNQFEPWTSTYKWMNQYRQIEPKNGRLRESRIKRIPVSRHDLSRSGRPNDRPVYISGSQGTSIAATQLSPDTKNTGVDTSVCRQSSR
jgi:hypothetical protein